ncbi:MAG: hypothetical protein WBN78_01930 [Gammaproteobacteria bacterium]
MTPQRLIIIFAMLLALPVNADELVDRADANGDGYVSLYELRAAYYADMEFNQRIEQSFAEYDTDGDGLISEAERQAQAPATAETTQKTAPRAGMAATASGEGAVAPVTGTAPATAAGTSTAPPAATVTTSPAGLAPTPPAGLSAAAATEAPAAPAAETVSVETPGMDTGANSPAHTSAGSSPEVAAATTTANVVLPDTRGLSRSELWIEQIDVDNSGGASITELVASGDGSQWFADSDFTSADKNGDGDLDPDELEVLLQSMERRRRR